MSHDVAIVDTGGANLASLRYALQRLGCEPQLTTQAEHLRSASHVILPGVGAAADSMARLEQQKLLGVLRELTQPVLGICLGMQLLAAYSEEQGARCIGITADTCTQLLARPGLPVPHMGWNRLTDIAAHPLLEGISADAHFYFVHSFAVPVSDTALARCHYGDTFAAVIGRDNFHGTQFHPERSAGDGARVLANFLRMSA